MEEQFITSIQYVRAQRRTTSRHCVASRRWPIRSLLPLHIPYLPGIHLSNNVLTYIIYPQRRLRCRRDMRRHFEQLTRLTVNESPGVRRAANRQTWNRFNTIEFAISEPLLFLLFQPYFHWMCLNCVPNPTQPRLCVGLVLTLNMSFIIRFWEVWVHPFWILFDARILWIRNRVYSTGSWPSNIPERYAHFAPNENRRRVRQIYRGSALRIAITHHQLKSSACERDLLTHIGETEMETRFVLRDKGGWVRVCVWIWAALCQCAADKIALHFRHNNGKETTHTWASLGLDDILISGELNACVFASERE